MNILGIDVGIKNLGYCLINKEKNNFEIIEWGIYNIIKEVTEKCTFGDSCVRCAKYSHNNINLCGIHAKSYSKKNLKSKVIIESEYNEALKNGICAMCKKKSSHIHKSTKTYYCKTHYNNEIKNQIALNKLEPIKTLNSKNIGLELICKELVNFVNGNEKFKNIDIIRIENQHQKDIVLTMKTISVMLYTLFTSKFIGTPTQVSFVNATTKITLDEPLYTKSWITIKEHITSLITKTVNMDGTITSTVNNCKKSCKICCLHNDYKKYKFPENYDEYVKFNPNNKKFKLEYLSLKLLSMLKVQYITGEKFKMIQNHSKQDDLCDGFIYAYES